MKYLHAAKILYVLFFYVSTADALKCFQCDSMDLGCSTLTQKNVESPYYLDCKDHPNPFCRKTVQTIFDSNNLERISRSCGWIRRWNDSRCYRDDNDFRFDRNCQCFEDGCNSAPPVKISRQLWPVFIIIATLLLP